MRRPALMRGALCALALCVAAAAKDDKAELPPAALADLPRLGADGTPVMTVDGRVCAFPWTGTDGVSHSTCAPLPASSAGDNVVWCKDIKAMWGICAAPRLAAAATVPAAAAATTASLPLMAGSISATASAAAADALAPAPAAGAKAAATQDLPMERDDPDADDDVAVAPAPAAAAAVAPAPSVAAAPSPEQKLGPLRASKGPAKLDASAQGAVLRLRSQLADAQAAEGAAKDDAARSAAAAKTRFVRQQLAAVQAGFIDPSTVGGAEAQGPQCNGLYRQCGGLQPGSNSDPWSGSAACCGNATCVQTDPNYAQCVPIDQSRSRGCGSLHAQCAGDFWAGPWCCATNLGCMWESKAFSKCQACNGAWAQCGGNEPDTGNKWSRATCCVSGHYCKWVNNGYSQCVKNGS